MTILEKINFLNAKIETLQIIGKKAQEEDDNDKLIYCIDNIAFYEELIRDLVILNKFVEFYIVGTYDDKDHTVLNLECGNKDVQDIEEYISDCIDDV